MRYFQEGTVDSEFQQLRLEGFTGSLNDMIKKKKESLGSVGTVDDTVVPTPINSKGFTEDFNGSTLSLGGVEFTQSVPVLVPTASSGDVSLLGTQYMESTDAGILETLKSKSYAVHIPFTPGKTGDVAFTNCVLFAAGLSTTNTEGVISFWIRSNGVMRFQIDGEGSRTPQSLDSVVTATLLEKQLFSYVIHRNEDDTGDAVSLYIDGIPVRTDLDINADKYPVLVDQLTLGARRGATASMITTGTIHKGMSVQTLTGSDRASQVKEACRGMKDTLTNYMPEKLSDTILAVGAGQSNRLGLIAGQTHPSPATIPAGVMYGVDVSNEPNKTLTDDMTGVADGGGVGRIGESSGAYGFASYMNSKYGYKTIYGMMAVTGSPLLDATTSSQSHWEIGTDNTNGLLTANTAIATNDPDAATQRGLLTHILDVLDYYPGLNVKYKVVLWNQGEADAPYLTDTPSPTSVNRYYRSLKGVANYFLNRGFDLFVIDEAMTSGTDASEVSGNEVQQQRLRNVQAKVVTSSDSIIFGSEVGPDTGSTFNTFTVDSDGVWTGGREFNADGVHYTGPFADAVAMLNAKNVGTKLSLTEI